MLDLLASRVLAMARGRYKQLELTASDFSRSHDLLSNALQGGRQLPRAELYRVLEQGGVFTAGQRGIHILGYLARQGLICFGPRSGKQPTFVLLDEWLPPSRSISKDEALSVLAARYISSHGPATARDFAWWSGLTVTQARAGLESARNVLVEEILEGIDYWLLRYPPAESGGPLTVTLLPPFDEYLVGYTDRSAVLDAKDVLRINAGGGMLNSVILEGGKVVGTWKRTLKANSVIIAPAWFSPPIKQIEEGFEQAAWQYATFLGLKAEINPSQENQTHPV